MPYFSCNKGKVFYEDMGEGEPLLMVHGNTASSKMFRPVLKHYKKRFRLIIPDLPGHGKSERLDKFPLDFWYDNAIVVNKLIRELHLTELKAIGTSGGALIVLNAALESPERYTHIIADSFEGEHSEASYVETLKEEREKAKKKFIMKYFWRRCHGKEWREVVDLDTEVNINFHREIGNFFHDELGGIQAKVLLTGSAEDEFIDNIGDRYAPIAKKIKDAEIKIFSKGTHPAMLTSGNEFTEAALSFLTGA
jgi:pimeloyl-ACP methyl ester carboxylesterase